jgi:hypothetical protein
VIINSILGRSSAPSTVAQIASAAPSQLTSEQ